MSTDSLFVGAPQRLGRYELLAPVARGGMGQVWVGRLRGARGFNKLVAIKTLLSAPDPEGRLESMLLEEARLASLIHHPNVVQTLELGEHEDHLYLVMEWVDGEPLAFIMYRAESRGGIPLPIAVHWIGQTLLGLHAAHELTDDKGAPLGVVHRDVSPHNVLVTFSGVAKLVDFGIAKATAQSATFSGEIKGKISYMAPEQVRCATVDRRTDLFAIGILLYVLTTGHHPFKSDSSAGLLQTIVAEEPAPPPSQWVANYPPLLEEVVLKALEKEPERRWSTAEEMYAALQRAVPQAFDAGIEAQVKQFLSDVLGDRAAMRREALRRAQLEADSRDAANGAQSPAQSGTSLRALSVDRSPAERSRDPTVEKAPRRLSATHLALGLGGLALLLGGGFFALRGASEPARAGGPAPSVELTPLSAAGSPRSEPRQDEPKTLAARTLDANAAVSTPEDSGAKPASANPTPTSSRADARQSRRRTKRGDKASELMRPEYAR